MPSHYANQFKYEFYLKDNWCFAIMLWLCWIKLQCTCITFVVLFWRVIGMNVESLFCRKCKLCSSYVPGQGLTHIPFLTSWNYVNVCVFSKQIFSYRISISWYVKVDTSRLSKLQNLYLVTRYCNISTQDHNQLHVSNHWYVYLLIMYYIYLLLFSI